MVEYSCKTCETVSNLNETFWANTSFTQADVLGMSRERRLCHFTWAFGRLSPPTGAVDHLSFWNCLIWLKKETFEFNSWNFKPTGSTNRGTVRTFYQSAITDLSLYHLTITSWDLESSFLWKTIGRPLITFRPPALPLSGIPSMSKNVPVAADW